MLIDDVCVDMHEVSSFDAIKTLHSQLDDDHSGAIDLEESVEVLQGTGQSLEANTDALVNAWRIPHVP